MNNELMDNAIDAAAKELFTDAPDELLKGVMYLIEKDAAPKRRFAFGRFTMFGAVAAAIIIIFGMRFLPDGSTGGELFSFNTSTNNAADSAAPLAETPQAAASESAPAPQAMSESEVMISGKTVSDLIPATESGGTSEALTEPDESVTDRESPAFGAPPKLSPIDQALYDWTHLRADELVSVEVMSRTDIEIVAIVVYESETLEITVTERDGEFEVTTSISE